MSSYNVVTGLTNMKPKKYLTVAQLCERWGNRSFMFIERKLRTDKNFPRPMRLGGRLRLFDEDAIEAYERSFTGDEKNA
jgi:predicted DNA-binding transcriptional regulator AlpA